MIFRCLQRPLLRSTKTVGRLSFFFKAIKQKLKINAFVGRSKNAILAQIWVAMVTYLLVAFARYCARYYARYCARYYARGLVGRYNGC